MILNLYNLGVMSLKEDTHDVRLEQVTKKSESGLVFYRKCIVDSQTFSVGNNILLRDEGRYKLGYLLKIYCRTKVNNHQIGVTVKKCSTPFSQIIV